MAHRENEAGVTRALAIGIRMTPAEMINGRYMRAPDGHEAPASRSDAMSAAIDSIVEDHLGGKEPEEEEELPEGEEPADDAEEGEEPESDEPNDEDDEAQPEPIAAPVSWDKDAKEAFAQLPRELQETVAEREAQRDKAIQTATTDAANAKRNATVEANAMFAETQRQYASHLEQLASRFAPQRPDPALLAQDAQTFYYLQGQYEQEVAQQQDMQQRAAHASREAAQREAITRNEELAKDKTILSERLGEDWTDPGKRQALLTSLGEVGAILGYSNELQGQANATDILALKAAAEWKAKADKFDKLQGTKMEAVRAAKAAPRVAKPGTAATRGEQSARQRSSSWGEVVKSRGKNGEASATYLESIGIPL